MIILPANKSLISDAPYKSVAWKGSPQGQIECTLRALFPKIRIPGGTGAARGAGSGNAWHPDYTIAVREIHCLQILRAGIQCGAIAETEEIRAILKAGKKIPLAPSPSRPWEKAGGIIPLTDAESDF